MRLAVLRPEPGNAATAARAEDLGFEVIRLPLFAVRPLAWEAPDPAAFDALLLTSANAVRHGGIAALRSLPVLAVGEATADAARADGFAVVRTGARDAAALIEATTDFDHILHLAGRDRSIGRGGRVAQSIAVYASDPLEIASAALTALVDTTALLHSARTARRLAELVAPDDRSRIRLAALSPAVARAAGAGWQAVAMSRAPTDAALLAAALRLGR